MHLQKIGLTFLVVLTATVSIPITPSFPLLFSTKRVLAQTTDARKAEADRLLQQGTEQVLKTNQFQAALQSCQQVLPVYREIKDHLGEAKALACLGGAYMGLKDISRATPFLQQSLAIAQEIKNPQLEAVVQKLLSLAPRIVEAERLAELGTQQLNTNQFQAALESFQQALPIYREIKSPLGEAKALVGLGAAYMGLKDISRATSFLQQALAIAQELKNPQLEAKVQKLFSLAPQAVEAERLAELGTQQLQTNQFQAALQSFQQALPIYREISRLGEGKALVGLAAAYIGLKDISRATSFLQQALAIAQEVKNPQLEEGIQKVLSLAPQALEVDKLANLGFQQLETSQFEAALQTWQQALTIYRQINSRQGEMNALNNLGVTYRYLGDYTKAIDYCQQSLVSAKGIKDRQGERNALSNLGNAYFFLGDYAKAIDYQQQSLAILREIADKSGERTVLNNLGYSLLKSGKLSEAENMLRTGIKVGETLRESLGSNDTFKVSIFEGQARTYSLLQQALIAQNKTNEALEIAERGRARAFVELWANRFTPSTTQSTIAAPSLPKIQQIAKEQNATLVEYSIINDEFQVGGKVQTKESELYIWVIKPTGEVTFRRADLKPLWQQQSTTLTGLVFDSRESIGARGRGLGAVARVDEESQTNRLQQLHQLLIDPIADLLPTDPNARVVFIPQNTLFLVPFPALVDASGKYLIEKHTLLTAPAIQVLEFTRQRRQFVPGEAKDVLVVGNPTMPRVSSGIGQPPQQLPSLPAAQQEATEIATLFNTQAITGNGATKAVVVQKMSQARVIHLATHGLLDYLKIFLGLPGAGAVALAPSGQDNGLLTTEEILNLKLNAELVVLSACDTGNGKITGDGIIGLSRSLITAGVPSVIVSLWSVPDAPTAFLMTQFYKNLQQNPDKAQALRSAMLITMKQHPNPKDWAAFTLIGEAE